MRVAQEFRVQPGKQKAGSTSIPAPIGGLNARDSVANMKATDAVRLDNMFPRATAVEVRNGYSAWNTFTGVCQTIMVYSGNTATHVFPCVKNGSTYSIFNGTSAGALSSPVVGGSGPTVQSLTSSRFDYVNFGTSGGQFLVAVNGANTPIQYDGSTWTSSGVSGGTPADYFTIGVYGNRIWHGVKNSLRVRYGAIDAIAGATTLLELGPLFKLGGYLNSIITLSDASAGLTDYIGFLSSEGEIVAFTGNVADATSWTRAAHFSIGRPVIKGNRCWVKYGGDALVLCADGVYPLRKAFQTDFRDSDSSVSGKIRNLINTDILSHGGRYGWQLMLHPTGSKLIVNVPTNEDVTAYQYVMNTETKSWCRFTGWNAFSFEVAQDALWMGMNGKMVKADTGSDDGGMQINWEGKQAFNYYGVRGRAKHMRMLRPIIEANGIVHFGLSVDTDFRDASLTPLRTIPGGNGDPWETAWDVTWSGSTTPTLSWYSARGIGHAFATKFKGYTNGVTMTWSATDALYEIGGVLA